MLMHIRMHPTTYADQTAIMIWGSLRLTAGDRYLLKKGCLSVKKKKTRWSNVCNEIVNEIVNC